MVSLLGFSAVAIHININVNINIWSKNASDHPFISAATPIRSGSVSEAVDDNSASASPSFRANDRISNSRTTTTQMHMPIMKPRLALKPLPNFGASVTG